LFEHVMLWLLLVVCNLLGKNIEEKPIFLRSLNLFSPEAATRNHGAPFWWHSSIEVDC
jgi:hypothetical protein